MNPEPFTHEKLNGDRTVVRFDKTVSQIRTESHEKLLDGLLAECDTLAVDLSETDALASSWWRWIGRLGRRAFRTGQRVVVVGASSTLRTTADAVGAKQTSSLLFVNSLDEAWKP